MLVVNSKRFAYRPVGRVFVVESSYMPPLSDELRDGCRGFWMESERTRRKLWFELTSETDEGMTFWAPDRPELNAFVYN